MEKLEEDLKGKINQEVRILIHTEIRDSQLGNMSPFAEPRKGDSEIRIIFLGIYGIGKAPLYIHGRDENGKNKLLRNSFNVWVDENSGNPVHEDETILQRLNDIDIRPWFKKLISLKDELKFIERVRIADPDKEYLAEKILKGEPDYYPARTPCYFHCYSIFNDDEFKFTEKVLAHLEKIV